MSSRINVLAFAVQSVPKGLQHPLHGKDVLQCNPLRQLLHPRGRQGHGLVIGIPAFGRQYNQRCPPVVRVTGEFEESVFGEVIDDTLDVLTIGPHVPGEPKRRDPPITFCEHAVADFEEIQHGCAQRRPA